MSASDKKRPEGKAPAEKRPAKKWYVVHTHAMGETKALAHLQRQGFEAYLPQYEKTRRHARKVETVAAALFPRYLFVRMDVGTERWRAVKSTHGIAHLIGSGEAPQPIADGIVELIRMREGADGLIALDADGFMPGQKIEITDGPFAEHLALFDAESDRDRVYVLLNLMGRDVRVRVPTRTLRAA